MPSPHPPQKSVTCSERCRAPSLARRAGACSGSGCSGQRQWPEPSAAALRAAPAPPARRCCTRPRLRTRPPGTRRSRPATRQPGGWCRGRWRSPPRRASRRWARPRSRRPPLSRCRPAPHAGGGGGGRCTEGCPSPLPACALTVPNPSSAKVLACHSLPAGCCALQLGAQLDASQPARRSGTVRHIPRVLSRRPKDGSWPESCNCLARGPGRYSRYGC